MEFEYKCQQCDGECELQGQQSLDLNSDTPFIGEWVVCIDCGYTIPKDTADVEQLENKLAECEKDYQRLKDVLKEIEVKARDY